jgi:hypothetical protein
VSTGVGCTVQVSGARLPDGSPTDDPTAPAALSGLEVTWGRSTTMDQPAMSTCTFDVLDPAGGAAFAGQLRVGNRVDVLGAGTIYPSPTVSTFTDPGFTSGTFAGIAGNAGGRVVPADPGQAGSTRINLVPNPGFEVDLTGWAAFGTSTRTRDTATRHSGAASVKVVVGTGAQGGLAFNGNQPGVVGGQTYTFSAWVFAPAGQPMAISLRLTADTIVTFTGTGAWQRVSATRVCPAGVTVFAGAIRTNNTTAATFYVDDVMVELGAAPGSYFDGSTPDTATLDYSWTGTPHASTSTATTAGVPATSAYLRIMAVDAAGRATMILAPAPFSDVVGAWDAIPTTSRGQVWSFGANLRAPVGAQLAVRPVLLAGPSTGHARRVLDEPIPEPGDGAWHTVSATFTPDVDGAWVGIEVAAYPVGPGWDELNAAWTWDTAPAAMTWDDLGSFDVDDVTVLAPAAGTTRTVDVFVGRITDLAAAWDEDAGAPVVKVTAMDLIADLENRYVGDEPWPAEPISARASRVLGLAGLPVPITVAPSLGRLVVSWKDADRAAAFGLIGGLATSADGVLWPAAHASTGSYLVLEDTAARVALRTLTLTGGTIKVVVGTTPGAVNLSACALLRDPVSWEQSAADVLTRASVTWKEQGTDTDTGKPTATDRTTTVIDTTLEPTYGTRAASISTELTAGPDATEVAARVLARASTAAWRATGVTLDDAWTTDTVPADVGTLLDLLDGTRRIGAPILLAGLPGEWTPINGTVPVYLEGGTYAFSDGAWVLDLTVSNATGQGQSAGWDELPGAWTWDQWDPAVTWDQLRGAAAP